MIGRQTRSTQRLRIAVGVVGPAEAVLVVGDPGNRRVVGAEGRAREKQPEAGAVEGLAGLQAPGGLIAHVVGLVGDQQGRPAAGGQPVRIRPGGDRLVGDGDAVEVGRLRPVRVRPVRLEVDAVAAPRRRPTGGRCGWSGRRRRRARRTRRSASGGRCAGRRWSCRPPASPRPGSWSPSAPARPRSPPPARSGGVGHRANPEAIGHAPRRRQVLRGVVQGRATIGSPAVGGRPTAPHRLRENTVRRAATARFDCPRDR